MSEEHTAPTASTPVVAAAGTTSGNPYLIPASIVIAGLFVAFAIFMTAGKGAFGGGTATPQGGKMLEASILPVGERDHIKGSQDAEVFLVEYSDYRCHFCGVFHASVTKLLGEYDGKVAWVYRHLPYQPGAQEAAVASECIAELAGEDAFWTFTEKALNDQQSLSPEWHLKTAQELGVEKAAFEECIASGRHDARIFEDKTNAEELGGQGTPYNVLVTRKGDTIKFAGALPYESVKVFVNRALKSLE